MDEKIIQACRKQHREAQRKLYEYMAPKLYFICKRYLKKEEEIGRCLYHLRKYLVRVKEENVCPTLTANMGLGGHNVPFLFDSKGIRKLTEYECLALQGFPKNFVFQSFYFDNKMLDHVIQITLDRPETGGLSGAPPEEAVSWGKINPNGNKVVLVSEVTMAFPLIAAALIERLEKKN